MAEIGTAHLEAAPREPDGGISIGEVGTTCVVVWRGEVTDARQRAQRDALAASTRRHGARTAFLCVVESGAPPPNEEMRRRGAAMIVEFSGTLAAVAAVIEGRGFAAAAARSVFSAINLFMKTVLVGKRRMPPITFVGSVEEAARFMRQHVDLGPLDRFALDVEKVRSTPAEISRVR